MAEHGRLAAAPALQWMAGVLETTYHELMNATAGLQERLELLSHAGAGAGCLLYGSILLGRDDRTELHRRMGRFLLVLGVGMLGRAAFWGTCITWLGHLMLGAFGLFPLLLARAFETLLHRSLHLVAKLVLLAGSVFFVGTCWTELAIHARWWGLALIGYHSACVAYLGVLAIHAYLQHRRSARALGPRRSLYGAAALVCAVAVALMATDWLYLLGLDLPRLGAVPTMFILYFGGALFHSSGDWRLRASVRRLGVILAASAVLAALIGLAVGGDSLASVLITMGVLVAATMICEPLRKHAVEVRSGRIDLLMERISHLPAATPDELLAALQRWPELERVCYLPAATLGLDSPRAMVHYFELNGSVLSRGEIEHHITMSTSSAQLFVLEQIHYLMESHGVDYLGLAGPDGDLLGIRLGMGPEPELYRRILAIIVNMLRQHRLAGAAAPAPVETRLIGEV
jgi:hypothetical protein